mgnify:CR=1 FL=1
MKDSEKTVKINEKSENEKNIDKLMTAARYEYYKEHGRWPEEDGVSIQVNT